MNELKSEPIYSFKDLTTLKPLDERLKSKIPFRESTSFSKESNCQKVLICHDYKGNYLEFDSPLFPKPNLDNNCHPPYAANGAFRFASHFVYFSHQFVSIPPLSW